VIKGFKEFLMRGNVVDLAVAVVIGAAFGAVVKAFSDGFIGGLIGAVGKSPNFDKAGFMLNGSKVVLGPTLTALINFVIIAAVVYFFVIVPMNLLLERRRRGEEPEPAAPAADIALLTEIRDLLRDRPLGDGQQGNRPNQDYPRA
jgi:large conductance mechanosensitive channel